MTHPHQEYLRLCCSFFCHERLKWMGWLSNGHYDTSRFCIQVCIFLAMPFHVFHRHFLVKVGLATVQRCIGESVTSDLGQSWIQAIRLLARNIAGLATWSPASVFLFHLQMVVGCSFLTLITVSKNSLGELAKGRQNVDQCSWFCPLKNNHSSLRPWDVGPAISYLAEWNYVH